MKEIKQQGGSFSGEALSMKKHKEDLSLIETFYRNKGYRDFKIVNDTIIYDTKKKKMNLVATLSEGPKYKYRNFTWEGQTLLKKKY